MIARLQEFIKTLPEGTNIYGIEVSVYDDELYYDSDTGWIHSR